MFFLCLNNRRYKEREVNEMYLLNKYFRNKAGDRPP